MWCTQKMSSLRGYTYCIRRPPLYHFISTFCYRHANVYKIVYIQLTVIFRCPSLSQLNEFFIPSIQGTQTHTLTQRSKLARGTYMKRLKEGQSLSISFTSHFLSGLPLLEVISFSFPTLTGIVRDLLGQLFPE